MKILKFATIITLGLTLLNSCGLTDDKESKAHDYLQQKVASDSKGALKLEDFKKTNGYEQDIFGMKVYVIEWQGNISAQKEIWSGSEMSSGYRYLEDFGVYTEEPHSWMSTPAKHFNKGTIVSYIGDCSLQKTEQGWVVKRFAIKSWQIVNEGSASN